MSCPTIILIRAAGRSVRARLMSEKNPEVVELVRSQLPLASFALHPNVSGEGFLMPTTITYTGPGQIVDRHQGAAYLYAPGQSIVVTYGQTHESACVNRFAEVLQEDLSELTAMGSAVYSDTLATAQHKVVSIEVSIPGDENTPSIALHAPQSVQFGNSWKDVEAIFFAEAIRALSTEPGEIRTCFAGIIPSGMGTGGNALPVWMHQWSYLMTDGPNTLYRFLMDAEIHGITLEIMVDLEFLGDLGLTKFKVWGEMYSSALDQLTSLGEYKKLTTALLTLVNLYHRRVQSRFPFFLGRSFPRVSTEEILLLATALESN